MAPQFVVLAALESMTGTKSENSSLNPTHDVACVHTHIITEQTNKCNRNHNKTTEWFTFSI